MEDLTDTQLTQALSHARRKAASVQTCRQDCLAADAAASRALALILSDTLRHASLLEGALRRRRCVPVLSPPHRLPRAGGTVRAQLDALAQEEALALTRQMLMLESARGGDAQMLRRITEEQAVHLRLLRTLAGRF